MRNNEETASERDMAVRPDDSPRNCLYEQPLERACALFYDRSDADSHSTFLSASAKENAVWTAYPIVFADGSFGVYPDRDGSRIFVSCGIAWHLSAAADDERDSDAPTRGFFIGREAFAVSFRAYPTYPLSGYRDSCDEYDS